jgi:hypothetical protein
LGDQIKKNRWAGHVARIGEWRGAYRVLVREQRERDHFEELGVDRNITLKWIIKKWDGVELTGLIWVRIRTGGGRL